MVNPTRQDGSASPQASEAARIVGTADGAAAAVENRRSTEAGGLVCGAFVEASEAHEPHQWRRNAASRTDVFEAALAMHAAMHTSELPLVQVDRAHAVDTWQWVLRLLPEAGVEVQIAALYHDIDRLIDEAEERVEHRAGDYQAFKDAHAQRGAELAYEALIGAGVPRPTARRACAFLAAHERAPDCAESRALADADALSFFGVLSSRYEATFGPRQTATKVRHTLQRLDGQARPWLAKVRLSPTVRALVDENARVDRKVAR